VILLLLGGSPSQPPADPPIDTKAEAEATGAGAKKLVAEFVVRLDASSDKRLKAEPEPVLRWTNHLGRRFYGDVFVWTHDGRPEVIVSINHGIQPGRRSREAEILSLSTGRPIMSHGETVIWEPSGPGMVFKPVPGAPKVGATAAERLRQMRDLAAQFSVVAGYGPTGENKETLRLMATPIYRYQSPGQGVADGAIFNFAQGTNPEAFLVIEARGKDPEWQFCFGRMNGFCSLRAAWKDKGVWQVDRLSSATIYDPKQAYFCIRR
jgi:hypothetical protein